VAVGGWEGEVGLEERFYMVGFSLTFEIEASNVAEGKPLRLRLKVAFMTVFDLHRSL